MSSLPFAALAEGRGFVVDARFSAAATPPPLDLIDPLDQAWHEGFAAGKAEGEAQAAAREQAEADQRARLELGLARLDAEQSEQLRRQLIATVAALCEASLAPLALDPELLARRVGIAVAMLARADDARVLRLHPEDLALIARQLPAGLQVEADPALERGALRIEGAHGGVEDGPEQWRRAVIEALSLC